jgi:hypothetical protein
MKLIWLTTTVNTINLFNKIFPKKVLKNYFSKIQQTAIKLKKIIKMRMKVMKTSEKK